MGERYGLSYFFAPPGTEILGLVIFVSCCILEVYYGGIKQILPACDRCTPEPMAPGEVEAHLAGKWSTFLPFCVI